jgi:Peptidase_C39 like family
MSKRILNGLSILAEGAALSMPAGAMESLLLPVKLEAQMDEKWCWAAAFQMVINHANPGRFHTQYEIVEKLGQDRNGNKLTGKCCGHSSVPTVCSVGGQLEEGDFHSFGFKVESTPESTWLPWEKITSEISAGFPMLDWAGGHMRVIAGYRVSSNGTRKLWIKDPFPPMDDTGTGGHAAYILYATYTNECYRTFYHVKKGPQP